MCLTFDGQTECKGKRDPEYPGSARRSELASPHLKTGYRLKQVPDPPRGSEHWLPTDPRFTHARDLVAYIGETHPDLCIGVAGKFGPWGGRGPSSLVL
jgi:hypothetical protein